MPKGFSTFQKYLILGGVLLCTGSLVLFTNAFAGTKIGTTLNLASTAGGLDYGLVGHWTFDGKDMPSGQVNDTSGNGNNGSMVNMATSTAYTKGVIGQAVTFDGNDDLITIPDSSSLRLSTGDWSVSFWAKTSTTSTNNLFIVSKRTNGSDKEYEVYLRPTGHFDVVVETELSDSGEQADSVDNVWSLGVWNYFTVVMNMTTKNPIIFVNGTQVSLEADSIVNQPTVSTAPVNIGTRNNGVSPDYQGFYDDIRLYNRMLTTDEVKQLYQLGATTKVATTPSPSSRVGGLDYGLVGHWTFDGKDMVTGQVNDTSGQGNNGSMVNMATSTDRVKGVLGQGLAFDGSDDYVQTSASPFNPSATSFSVSTWLNIATTSGSTVSFFSQSDGGGTGRTWLELTSALSLQSRLGGGTLSSGYTVSLNVWTLITIVYDLSASTLTWYIDGAQVGQNTGVTIESADGVLQFGAPKSLTSNLLPGKLDDIHVYNRTLSPDEVRQLYQLGATTKVATTPNTSSRVGGLDYGLVGHWTFDGKDMVTGEAADTSGNANTGSLVSISTSTSRVKGVLGQGLVFNGSTNYIRTSDSSSFSSITTANKMSMTAWVKTTSTATNQFVLARYDGAAGDDDWVLAVYSNNLRVFFRDTATWYDSGIAVNDNAWHQITITFDGSMIRTYVDGVAGNSFDGSAITLTAGTTAYSIGGASTFFYTGSLDDVRLYNRALSLDEAKQLYQMGR